jgi:mycothiol synthase
MTRDIRARKPLEPPGIPGLVFRQAARQDWAAMADAMSRANLADGIGEVSTAESIAAEWEPRDAFDLGRDVLLAEIDGRLAGFAFGFHVERDGSPVCESWGVVVPEDRRRGIGATLIRATRARLAAETAADPRDSKPELRAFAMDVQAGTVALLTAEGYVPIRFGYEMRRPLTGQLPAHELPQGLEVRPVTPDQHRAIFDADSEAFLDHWGHRTQTEGDFVAAFAGPSVDTSLWCVAWEGDQVAGVVMNYIYDIDNAQLGTHRGWLAQVSVRRPWRGRGVAKALCAASFRALRDRGMDEAWLGVDAANPTGALQLYEDLGFTVVRTWRAYGRPLDRPAPAGWRPGDR